jgi:ATP-dependent exoDNAse (exonuclease V) alpha subunit
MVFVIIEEGKVKKKKEKIPAGKKQAKAKQGQVLHEDIRIWIARDGIGRRVGDGHRLLQSQPRKRRALITRDRRRKDKVENRMRRS